MDVPAVLLDIFLCRHTYDTFQRFFIVPILNLGGAVLPGLVDGHTHPVWAGQHYQIFLKGSADAAQFSSAFIYKHRELNSQFDPH